MGIISYLARNRRIAKITTIVAMFAAITLACRKKPEDFLQYVEPHEQNVAASLYSNPDNKEKWDKAVGALGGISHFLNSRKNDFPNSLGTYISTVADTRFYGNMLSYFQGSIKNQIISEFSSWWVKPIKDAGMEDSAKKWENKLIAYFNSVDTTVAERMRKDTDDQIKRDRNLRKSNEEHKILENLEKLRKAAKKAEFKKVEAACEESLERFTKALRESF